MSIAKYWDPRLISCSAAWASERALINRWVKKLVHNFQPCKTKNFFGLKPKSSRLCASFWSYINPIALCSGPIYPECHFNKLGLWEVEGLLIDSTRENGAKARKGDCLDLDGPIMDGAHYPRYLQGQMSFGLWRPWAPMGARADFVI